MITNVIAEIVLKKFNLCVNELFQLKNNVDENNSIEFLKEILKEILSGDIKSPHINKRQAKKILNIINYTMNDLNSNNEKDRKTLNSINDL